MESPFSEPGLIFESKAPFREGYHPDEIIGREDEIDELGDAFQDVVEGFPPPNVFVYGQVGNGKTVVTRSVMRLMKAEAEAEGVPVEILWTNCNAADSLNGVLTKLVNQLRPDDNQIPVSGPSNKYLWKRFTEELDRVGGSIIVVLDEIDMLAPETDKLLYELPRARSHGAIDEARVGVVGISNDYLFKDDLDPRVLSTLCEVEIEFPPYDANELQDILEYYADIAFKPSVLTDGAIQLCAAYPAQEQGDARHALNLLETAGNLARKEAIDSGTEQVTEAHVRAANDVVEEERIKDIVDSQFAPQVKRTLLAATLVSVDDTAKATTGAIHDRYNEVCATIGKDALSRRRMMDFLKTIRLSGVYKRHENNSGARGGRQMIHEPNVEPELIFKALAADTDLHPAIPETYIDADGDAEDHVDIV